jgi:hypothetical protein
MGGQSGAQNRTHLKIIQLPDLNRPGWGLGNKLHFYAHMRKYAEDKGATLEVPSWDGQRIFQLSDNAIDKTPDFMMPWPLPEDFGGRTVMYLSADKPGRIYHQNYTDDDFRRYFQIKPELVHPPVEVAVHFRRGDFLDPSGNWPVLSLECLRAQVEAHGFDWQQVKMATDGTGSPPPPFEADFEMLANARNLFVYPSSTFSGSAARLNRNNVFFPQGFHGGPTTCTFYKRP